VWFSPSYSPQTGLFYVAVREIGAVYFKREAEYKEGTFYAGGGVDELPPDDSWGAIRALDVKTGDIRWEFKIHSPPWAGVLSTAGGLVFWDQTKVTSMRSMRKPESRCGIFRQEAPSVPTQSHLQSMAGNASRLARTGCCTFSDYRSPSLRMA
jgi:hypothetical protein